MSNQVYVLGISSSPRNGSNSRILLEEVMKGARNAGAETEIIDLRRVEISPCVACDGCIREGRCVVTDDFQMIYEKLLRCDRVILATPIYFMHVSAQLKTLLDRCQSLWTKKYVRKEPIFLEPPGVARRGYVIGVCGSSIQKWFDSVHLTMYYVFDVLEVTYGEDLFFARVDKARAIEKRKDALEAACEMGKRVGTP